MYDKKVENGWVSGTFTVVWSVENEIICFGEIKLNINGDNYIKEMDLSWSHEEFGKIARVIASDHHVMIVTKSKYPPKDPNERMDIAYYS